ncbi:MAG: DegV family protein [Candidatus Howiella sp.]|jgi:DegV family protein with EDD domain
MARKVAIVTDSNSGITQTQGKALGVFVLPMPFVIGENTYYEDVNLSQTEFYEKLASGVDVSTSQPVVGDLLALWDRVLETYDELVHIPMSSGLSGSCATAVALSQDYDGRVCVVNNQRISVTQRQSVLDAMALAEAGKSAAEIACVLEETKLDSSIYIMLDTLKYLKKGGRVTPAAAAIATVLKIKPVLQIQGEKLDAFAKARTEKIGREIMIDAMRRDIDGRFGGVDQVRIFVAHTDNEEAADNFANVLKAAFGVQEVHIDPLSLSVSCHIGPGALAVACAKKIDGYMQ